MESILLRCIHLLTTIANVDEAVDAFLKELGTYCEADRAYIFEYSEDSAKLSNTFEWCAEGVSAQKDILQNLDMEVVADWNRRFEEQGDFMISSLDAEVAHDTETHRLLEIQGVESLMAAPLKLNDKLVGFLGVDNPRPHSHNLDLLRATTDIVAVELERRRMTRRLEKLSFTDMLTGADNRNSYIRELNERYRNLPDTLGVIVVDINGLKAANDQYGHGYGDMMIRKTAAILQENLPFKVYRIGGDEFIIPCPDIAQAEFEALCERLHAAFDGDKEVSVSIGCSWKGSEIDIDQQILCADELMYVEKESYYHDAFQGGVRLNRSNATGQLLQEIGDGRFVVYYQPKVDIETGEIIGAEALVRKLDEEGRLIPPDHFIPMYEAQGIMMHVDIYVLETVLKLLAGMKSGEKMPRISVNFSRSTLLLPDFAGKLIALFEKYGVAPGAVMLEVTERASRMSQDALRRLIADIHSAGIQVSLDDFGMEYSNLAMLTKIGVDEIKLDRSLVDGICENERGRIVVQNIINMCRQLGGMSIIAEGIETQAQRETLMGYACKYGQGYLFHRPMPQDQFIALLNKD